YRVDSSRARKTGGVGVGLTISKSIIEAHGGHINVKSKLNKGSEFIISLPLTYI
ncbi:sensor histidine kinase, partial [Clostridium saudiense]|nr:sensor histidine kinase [Clostridium saudiense]